MLCLFPAAHVIPGTRGDGNEQAYFVVVVVVVLTLTVYYKKKYTPAVRSKILSKLIFASCVWYSDRAYYGLCVRIKDIGRRLPLQLQCSYQGQQGDISQSVRGNYKTRFWGRQNLTAVEGNASVYQVNPVSRITGEGRAELRGGLGLIKD